VAGPCGRDQVLELSGRVDGTTAAEVRPLLHQAVDDGAGALVVDLGGVDVLDAVGLGVLFMTARRARLRGRRLVLRHAPVRMARLLAVARAHQASRQVPPPAG
jgi:anti-anti-sigma factor